MNYELVIISVFLSDCSTGTRQFLPIHSIKTLIHCPHLRLNCTRPFVVFRMATIKPAALEAASNKIHEAWMGRNPKQDWNAAQHVPYTQLPEAEKDKDRAQVKD